MDEPDAARAAWIESALAKHGGPLVEYAARRLAGDAHRARDVVQETFLRLVGARRDEVDGHLAAWLYTVCRRLCVDALRRETRMQPTETELLDTATGREADPAIAAVTGLTSTNVGFLLHLGLKSLRTRLGVPETGAVRVNGGGL